MNKIKILAVLGIAAGLASAAGDLWRANSTAFPSLQVKTPGSIVCWGDPANAATEENSYSSPCYEKTGGWWFGYDFGDNDLNNYGDVQDAYKGKSLTPKDSLKLADKEGSPKSGSGLTITERAIAVKFILQGGEDTKPSGAGIGFNWRQKDGTDYENKKTEDISGKPGICLTYKLEEPGEGHIFVELGWNETTFEYNTWVFPLEASLGWNTINLLWTDFGKSWTASPVKGTLDEAKTLAEALKFKAQNKGAEPVTFDFLLGELGWSGTCDGAGGTLTPISKNIIATSGKFNLVGRNLSLVNVGSASASVQVINMQGAIVAQKMLAGENKILNLSNMPTGVYLVRSAELGISQKIILK